MLCLIAVVIALAINSVHSVKECRTVKQDAHYTSQLPFYGFKTEPTLSTWIQFTKSTAHYLFPPTESRGRLCTTSWNQLFGSCRCGYLNSVHSDSDRFVWRRANSCVEFDSTGHVIGERKNCKEANLIEIAAAAYDNGLKPFEHQGTLLKEFSTKVRIETWYRIEIRTTEMKTTYKLFNDKNKLIETQEINHRSCDNYQIGLIQGLYFGGQCPAPQEVSVCYEDA